MLMAVNLPPRRIAEQPRRKAHVLNNLEIFSFLSINIHDRRPFKVKRQPNRQIGKRSRKKVTSISAGETDTHAKGTWANIQRVTKI